LLATLFLQLAIVVWFIIRATKKGSNWLIYYRGITFVVSFVLTVPLVVLSHLSYYPGHLVWLENDYLDNALYYDFGASFWTSVGCSLYSDDGQTGYLSCINLIPTPTDTVYSVDGGFACAVVSAVFSTVFMFYVWGGSFTCCCSDEPCCACCPQTPVTSNVIITQNAQPEVVETTTTTTTTPVQQPMVQQMVQPMVQQMVQQMPVQPMVQQMVQQMPVQQVVSPLAPTYTLLVHHGNPMPTQIVLNANNMQDLCGGVAMRLGINVPFSLSVFDPNYSQFVPLAGIEGLPPQATVQVNFI